MTNNFTIGRIVAEASVQATKASGFSRRTNGCSEPRSVAMDNR